jgi:UDP:flavonoid glycosyltransferase YjiC (YdhE family)
VRAFEPDLRSEALAALALFARYGAVDRADDLLPLLLEALAAGCVLLLPPARREQLGDAALYAAPSEVAGRALELRDDPTRLAALSAQSVAAARERFGPARHLDWLRPILGNPAGAVVRPLRPRRRQVLFIASNGVGMGHLTRCLAIARRCPPALQPVFFTFSQGIAVVEAAGFPVHYSPDARALAVDQAAWNRHVEAELREICALWDPAVLVFDGNNPYTAVVRVLETRRSMAAVWVRRALWRPGRGASSVEREAHFDMVLEPGDVAEADDRGLTREHRARTRRIAPVRLVEDGESLSRERAREDLGVGQDTECVLLAFGAGNNFDFRTALGVCVDFFAPRGADLSFAESPITRNPVDLPPSIRRVHRFPLASHLAAFDMAVSAAGYNSFHELLLAGLPTLFVPNAEMTMDDQETRAAFAARCGLGLTADAGNPYALRSTLKRLCDPSILQELRRRMQRLDRSNGAFEAAQIIEELAWTMRYGRASERDSSN